jgi:hypothetical protein
MTTQQKISHLKCPSCGERRFALSFHIPYTEPFASESCEGMPVLFATCFICAKTFPATSLQLAGSFNPGKTMDEAFANAPNW